MTSLKTTCAFVVASSYDKLSAPPNKSTGLNNNQYRRFEESPNEAILRDNPPGAHRPVVMGNHRPLPLRRVVSDPVQ